MGIQARGEILNSETLILNQVQDDITCFRAGFKMTSSMNCKYFWLGLLEIGNREVKKITCPLFPRESWESDRVFQRMRRRWMNRKN
jgi:hypothetical protein